MATFTPYAERLAFTLASDHQLNLFLKDAIAFDIHWSTKTNAVNVKNVTESGTCTYNLLCALHKSHGEVRIRVVEITPVRVFVQEKVTDAQTCRGVFSKIGDKRVHMERLLTEVFKKMEKLGTGMFKLPALHTSGPVPNPRPVKAVKDCSLMQSLIQRIEYLERANGALSLRIGQLEQGQMRY